MAHSCLKLITGLGAIIILLIGFAMLGVSIYEFLNPEIFLGDTSERNIILGILVAAAIFIISGAITGLVGICKQSACALCSFQIIVIIFMVVFAGLGVGAILLPSTVFEGDCTVSKNQFIMKANQLYNQANIKFCHADCPCQLSTSSLNNNYNISERAVLSGYQITGTKKTVKDCIANPDAVQTALMNSLEVLQKSFSCSMWCKTSGTFDNLLYHFTDVNNGKPEHFCYDKIKQALTDNSKIIQYVTFGASALMLLMFIFNMVLCCSKQRKDQSLRERFIVVRPDQMRYQQNNGFNGYQRM